MGVIHTEVANQCHPERSEGSGSRCGRCFAALSMTGICLFDLSPQLTDRTNAQPYTIKPHVHYPGSNEHPARTHVIRDHSCQRKPHRPETVSSQLINTADAAQPVIWHN